MFAVLRPVLVEDGSLVVEIHLFGPYFTSMGGQMDPIRSIGWSCQALLTVPVNTVRVCSCCYLTEILQRQQDKIEQFECLGL